MADAKKPAKVYTPLDATGLAKTVVVALWVFMAGNVLSVIAGAVYYQALSRYPSGTSAQAIETAPDMLTPSLVLGAGGLLMLISYIVAAILFLKWTYRINRNSHALTTGLKVSPPWSVGWYFIPIATLWKPFQAMAESWRVAEDPNGWRALPTPAILRWWWGLWLVTGIMGNASMRLSFTAKTAGLLEASALLDLVGGVLTVPLVLIVIRIVRQLTERQASSLSVAVFEETPGAPKPAGPLVDPA